MNITNKRALPEPLIKAIEHDLQPRTGFSVTDLINPPRMTQLERRHWDSLTEDAAERVWVLLGSSIHAILEKAEIPGASQEVAGEVNIDGTIVHFHPDLCMDGTIDDYKVTSVWSIVFEPNGRSDWHSQLNLYRYLKYKLTGDLAKELRVCAILRDWVKTKIGEYGYPAMPVAMIDIPIWPVDKAEAYLKERIRLHLKAEQLPDDKLPLCSPEETWDKPTTYAVMKRGRQSALRVFATLAEAKKMMSSGLYLETRPGEKVRCRRYCSVNKYCNQYAIEH
jgi:hypothetical protein